MIESKIKYKYKTMNKAVFDGNAQCCDIMNGLIKEKVSSKFDINSLKPFDKVLVRDNNEQKWTIDYFSFVDKEQVYPFVCVGHYTNQCIPYEGNKHLLGKTDDCDEYYKTWE